MNKNCTQKQVECIQVRKKHYKFIIRQVKLREDRLNLTSKIEKMKNIAKYVKETEIEGQMNK